MKERFEGEKLLKKLPTKESLLRASVPVFINCFNQYTYLNQMISWFLRHGFRNIQVVDQNSDFPPLIQFYKDLEDGNSANIVRLEENIGPRRALEALRAIDLDFFVFTDPDLALPDPPHPEFLSRLLGYSTRYRCRKVGLALDISEPDSFKNITWKNPILGEYGILDWERRFWVSRIEKNVYRAEIDTTFFVWNKKPYFDVRRSLLTLLKLRGVGRIRKHLRPKILPDIRVSGDGFVAKHLPWYLESTMPSEEEKYYVERASQWSTWTRDNPRFSVDC